MWIGCHPRFPSGARLAASINNINNKFTKNQYKKQSVNSTRKSGNPQVFFTEMYQGWGLGPLEALSLVLIRSKNGGKKMNNFVPGRKSL